MRRTDAWWVCNVCKHLLIKQGKGQVKDAMLEHRKTCYELATFKCVQVEQRKHA